MWPASHLEDIDSINFALALREYDLAAHQPHPPGYPVFIFLARLCASLLAPWVTDHATRAALAMSLLAGVAGAFALYALYQTLCLLTDESDPDVPSPDSGEDAARGRHVALLATALTGAAPLFWITSSRPLSDVPGLAGVLGCHWLIVRVLRQRDPWRPALLAACASGLALGLRSQVAWLVAPMMVWLVAHVWRRLGPRQAMGVGAAAIVGALVWAVPMIALTGGIDAYIDTLARQANEDIEGVPMLALRPDARQLATAIIDTFVQPWASWFVALPVLAFALLGTSAVRTHRRTVAWVVGGFGPYVVYHLLFQETETTRYALPIVPAVATMGVLAGRSLWPRVATLASLAVMVAALGLSVQAHRQYLMTPVTSQEAVRALDDAARGEAMRPTVVMHRRVWAETRRVRGALDATPAYDLASSPRDREWQQILPAAERQAPVWWLVDPRRGDVHAVDPRALAEPRTFAWPMPVAAVLGGMRPHAFTWYRLRAPQWLLGDGWGLTPELAGLSAAANQGPSTSGAEAFLRSTGGTSTLLVGGRHIAPAGSAPVAIDVRVGETWRQRVTVPVGAFAFTWSLPPDATTTSWTPVRVTAAQEAGRTRGSEVIFLEQFDRQPVGVPVTALEDGWFEPERDPATGRQWRWVGETSTFRVTSSDSDVQVDVAGTYPRHYDEAPVLEMHVGGTLVSARTLSRPFRIVQRLGADVLRRGDGRVTWRVTRSFVAGERTGTPDARRLALEIASLRVDAVR